jgi:hypothetical protein
VALDELDHLLGVDHGGLLRVVPDDDVARIFEQDDRRGDPVPSALGRISGTPCWLTWAIAEKVVPRSIPTAPVAM